MYKWLFIVIIASLSCNSVLASVFSHNEMSQFLLADNGSDDKDDKNATSPSPNIVKELIKISPSCEDKKKKESIISTIIKGTGKSFCNNGNNYSVFELIVIISLSLLIFTILLKSLKLIFSFFILGVYLLITAIFIKKNW